MDDTSGAEFDREIHERLLGRDPVAPAELANAHLVPLSKRLKVRFPNLPDETLIWDAVTDAVLGYAQNPERFDPSKSPLAAYLWMAARGDLLNALEQEKNRVNRLIPLDAVEVVPEARNPSQETHDMEVLEADETLRSLAPQIREAIPDARDLDLVALLMAGERKTEPFAAVLGITHLSTSEQRREVKRHKDRLKKRLERLGVRAGDEEE